MCRLCHLAAVSAHGDFKYRLDVHCHYQQPRILTYVIAKGNAASSIDRAIRPRKEQFHFYEQYGVWMENLLWHVSLTLYTSIHLLLSFNTFKKSSKITTTKTFISFSLNDFIKEWTCFHLII